MGLQLRCLIWLQDRKGLKLPVISDSAALCFNVFCGGLELLQVVSAVVNNDLQGLVESRPLKVWKETLALICTVSDS